MNTLKIINIQKEWVSIGSVAAHKRYEIAFTPTEIASVKIHLHNKNGTHLAPLMVPGAALFGGFEYKYTISPMEDGELTIWVSDGNLNNISLEEMA